jgi:GT2 family glycosyltransferase
VSITELDAAALAARKPSYTIVVLTFDRNHLLERLLGELQAFAQAGAQIIIVDNASSTPAEIVTRRHPGVTLIRSARNLGAAGRNLGFAAATGDIVLCLDDDVHGLSRDAFERLEQIFADAGIGAVNFKVREEGSGRIVNWVHHRSVEQFADASFETYEITEGAVAFRRSILQRVGGYAEAFFLSHEGPDLALRIMDQGARLIYHPAISVTHSFAPEGRPSWRKYYYDTRNMLWLAARNLPLVYGMRLIARQTLAMLVYSLRDGYVRWWAKGLWDGLRGMPAAWNERHQVSPETMQRIRRIDSYRAPLLYQVRKRFFSRSGMRL